MSTQAYRDQYLAAFHQAGTELDEIFQEYELLQARKQQIENLVVSLQPFLADADVQPAQKMHRSIMPAQTSEEDSLRIVPDAPSKADPISAPPSPTAMDPIQRRINSALGLAVA